MDCRAASAHKYRTRSGLKQYGAILTKEKSVVVKIMNLFEGENMQAQNNSLSNLKQ